MITRGVDPQLCCYYKSSRLKQYFKEHRALRTETVIGEPVTSASVAGSTP